MKCRNKQQTKQFISQVFKQYTKMSLSYFLIYIIAVQVVEINSRTSTLWKLNTENGKIISFSKNGQVFVNIIFNKSLTHMCTVWFSSVIQCFAG